MTKERRNQAQSILAKGIMLIFGANVINAIFSAVTNFALPKFLSIEAYSGVKTYYLYLSYIGLLHLGYSDGVYLKYGGKKPEEISSGTLRSDISTMRVFQFIVVLLCIGTSAFINDYAFFMCALTILPYNMAYFFRYYYQAVGEFNEYARIMNYTAISTFAVNIILLLCHVFNDYRLYLLFYFLVNTVIWLLMEINIKRKMKLSSWSFRYFSFDLLKDNIRMGFFLMLGTFSSIVLTGMDRWFIKIFMDNNAFAYYSFAVSIEGLLNIAITPVTTTLYNFFCNHKEVSEVRRIKVNVFLLASLIISSCFIVKWIISIYIPKYVESIQVLYILFAAQVFFTYVRSIYVNLYKADRRQNIYFRNLIIVIAIGAIFNYVLYHLLHTKEAFAIGTLLSAIVWYMLSMMDMKDKPLDFKITASMLLVLAIFLISGFSLSSYLGLVAYLFGVICISILFYRNECIGLYYRIRELF